MTIAEEIKQIGLRLHELIGAVSVQIQLSEEGIVTVQEFHINDYKKATVFLRSLGIKTRSKQVFENFTCVSGMVDGVKFEVHPSDLPPTCHKEEYVERIPKTQTVETGEFIEITKTRIVCSGDDKAKKWEVANAAA